MRYSKQRELILNALKEDYSHPTAETIYEKVRKIEPNISLGTVYRNLQQLARAGLITRIPMPCGMDCFDYLSRVHFHRYCKVCSCVDDIPEALNDSIIDVLTALDADSLLIEWTCPNCRQKSEESIKENRNEH